MTLIEVMVALGILSVVLMSLGGLMYEIARQTRRSALATYRAAASRSASSWIQLLPFDSLDNAIGCTADSVGILEYNRCVTLSNVSGTRKSITIVIQPTGNLITTPDTQVLERARAQLPSPLVQ